MGNVIGAFMFLFWILGGAGYIILIPFLKTVSEKKKMQIVKTSMKCLNKKWLV